MKITFTIFFLLLLLLLEACQPKIASNAINEDNETIAEDSVVFNHVFLKGSGLGGETLEFNKDSTFSLISFCDICPKSAHTYGYYIEDSSRITLIDTIWYYVNYEDGAKSFNFSDKRKKYHTHNLDKVYIDGKLGLSESPRFLKRGYIFKKIE